MFTRVQLNREDRDVCRFLWRHMETWRQPTVYMHSKISFGRTDASYSAVEVLHTEAERRQDDLPEASKMVREATWTDDTLGSVADVETAIRMRKEIQEIGEGASMEYRKWISNSKEVMQSVPKELRSTASELSIEASEADRAATDLQLGIRWIPAKDVLHFSGFARPDLLQKETFSRRDAASATGFLYDPLGQIVPFTILLKMGFQDICQQNPGPAKWDEPLPLSVKQQWKDWIIQFPELSGIQFPRCVTKGGAVEFRELHGFGDASERAVCAAIYLVTYFKDGSIDSNLVLSKAKVAVKGADTIPRMELLASLMTTRLMAHVKKSCGWESIPQWFHTDSTVVLFWTRGTPSTWRAYVYNRLKEVMELSKADEWRWTPTDLQPADLGSRGVTAKELAQSRLWKKGPTFLMDGPDTWPEQPEHSSVEEAGRRLAAKELRTAALSLVVQVGAQEWNTFVDRAIETFHFEKALRLIARVRKLFLLMAAKKKIRLELTQGEKDRLCTLSDRDMQDAMEECTRLVQINCFQPEIAALRGGTYKPSRSRLGNNITVFLDKREGIRVDGRFQQSGLPFEQKHPLVLPSDNPVTHKIILYIHRSRLHISPEMVLYHSRFFVWVLRGLKTASRVIRKQCIPCKRWTGKPAGAPMGDLPQERLQPSRPFAHCGLDVGGPCTVRLHKTGARKYEKRGRPSLQTLTATRAKEDDVPTEKAYFLVFTCFATRFLQVELLKDLTADSICEAITRVASSFGKSESFYSDNAQYFRRAKTLVADQVGRQEVAQVRRTLQSAGITWDFAVSRCPHMNGCAELAIRSLKVAIRKVLGGALLTFEELRTVISQAVGFINSRPLATLTEDVSFSPVTPNLLVLGYEPTRPEGLVKPEREQARHLKLRLKHRQAVLDQMWARWKKDYLAQLIQTKKWHTDQGRLKPEDVVLVGSEMSKRVSWPLAKVHELIKGRDGKVRSALIRLGNGTTLKRSLHHLYPLEVADG